MVKYHFEIEQFDEWLKRIGDELSEQVIPEHKKVIHEMVEDMFNNYVSSMAFMIHKSEEFLVCELTVTNGLDIHSSKYTPKSNDEIDHEAAYQSFKDAMNRLNMCLAFYEKQSNAVCDCEECKSEGEIH